MNKYILIFLSSLLVSFPIQSQTCQTQKDELFFVEVNIIGDTTHPIIMSGLTKQVDMKKYNLDNPILFLESFYKSSKYMPPLQVIGEHLPDTCQAMGYNQRSMAISNGKLYQRSIETQLSLKTNESVLLIISKVKIEYLVVNKTDPIIVTNSSEIPVSEIENIKECYIPLKVYHSKKPKKKELK
jgi:hypothetical protein